MFTHGQKNDPTFRVVDVGFRLLPGADRAAQVPHKSCATAPKLVDPRNKSTSWSKFRHRRRLTPTRLFHVRVSGLFIASLLW